MKAGRELDALVAEKVMGLKRVMVYMPHVHSSDSSHIEWLDENGPNGPWGKPLPKPLRPYSTDIAAAWEVLLTKFSFHFREYKEGSGSVGVAWTVGRCEPAGELVFCEIEMWNGDGYDRFVERADTAPLAICLAAVNAIEVKNG